MIKKYKDYEKIFKKVTLAAQTAYYKEKLDIRINTVKQLRTNLNRISSLSFYVGQKLLQK